MTKQEFFSQYEIDVSTGRLGGGGFGEVFKAYDNVNSVFKAVKISAVKYVGGKKFSLIDEFNATNNLKAHRNIANYESVFQFEMPNGIFDYAVMQYYPLGNLKELLKAKELTTTQRIEIAKGLISGVHFLHTNKIIHRDLKPSNILVAERKGVYTPKIADFGLSKFYDSEIEDISNSVGAGTLEYSSPEQLKGLTLKANTDIWSIGVVIYELFLGNIPFETNTAVGNIVHRRHKILENIASDRPIDNIDKCPAPYNAIVRQALIKDPSKRVQSTSTLYDVITDASIASNVQLNNPDSFASPGDTNVLSKEELDKLIRIERKQKEQKNRFDEKIAEGDTYFNITNWKKALESYRAANDIIPDQQIAIDKINDCQQLINEEEHKLEVQSKKSGYNKYVSLARECYDSGNWNQALTNLSLASNLLPLDPEALKIQELADHALVKKKEQDLNQERLKKQKEEELERQQQKIKQEQEAKRREEQKRKEEKKKEELERKKQEQQKIERQKREREEKDKQELEKKRKEEEKNQRAQQIALEKKAKEEERIKVENKLKAQVAQRKLDERLASLIAESDTLFKRKEWSKAILGYQQILDIQPNHKYALKQIARCKRKRDRVIPPFFKKKWVIVSASLAMVGMFVGICCAVWYLNTYGLNRRPLINGLIRVKSVATSKAYAVKAKIYQIIKNTERLEPQKSPRLDEDQSVNSAVKSPSVISSSTESIYDGNEKSPTNKTLLNEPNNTVTKVKSSESTSDVQIDNNTSSTTSQESITPEEKITPTISEKQKILEQSLVKESTDLDETSPVLEDQSKKAELNSNPIEEAKDVVKEKEQTTEEVKLKEAELPQILKELSENTYYLNNKIGIAIYEVTQREFENLMGYNPSDNNSCPSCPVENVSYQDALEYIDILNDKARSYNLNYRLPSATEWETFAKAGTSYTYPGGNDPERIAVYRKSDLISTVSVRTTKSNNYGIRGMAGNVAEWTSTPYPSTKKRDVGKMIIKGGSFYSPTEELEITNNQGAYPEEGISTVGFRLISEKL